MAQTGGHAALMDEVYRGQRHIYDFTRKYYLFGRDTLIAGLDAEDGMRVLEVACGTGRNLARIGKAWPGTQLYGLDISAEMLKSARARLAAKRGLALAMPAPLRPNRCWARRHLTGSFYPIRSR